MAHSTAVHVSTVQDVTVAKITIASVLDAVQIERIGADLCVLADNALIRKLVLDMGATSHLSSAALGMLITVQKKCDATQGEMIICGLDPSLRRIFKLSQLEKMFTFAKDKKKALESFGVRV